MNNFFLFKCLTLIGFFFNRTHFFTYSFLGKAVATDLPAPIYQAIANYLDKQDCPQLAERMEVYHRASKGSDIFYSTEYKRLLLRNSTAVQYRTDDNTSLYGSSLLYSV